MSRPTPLHLLVLALGAPLLGAPSLGGCNQAEGGSRTSSPPPGRVVAVAAQDEDPAEELCDVSPAAGEAPAFTFPELAEGSSAPAMAGGARWVNVWATWCRPCVEEMPLLVGWRERLAQDGVEVQMVFLSADADDAAVQSFRQEHPNVPAGPRVAEASAIAAWAGGFGLQAGGTLPLHVITDAQGRVRCARAGAISDGDYDAVRRLLSEL